MIHTPYPHVPPCFCNRLRAMACSGSICTPEGKSQRSPHTRCSAPPPIHAPLDHTHVRTPSLLHPLASRVSPSRRIRFSPTRVVLDRCVCATCSVHSIPRSHILPLFELWFKLWVGGGVDTHMGPSRECARCPIHSTRVLLRCSMHKNIVSTASRHVSSPPLECSNVRVSGFRAPESRANGRIIVQSTSSHSHPPSLPFSRASSSPSRLFAWSPPTAGDFRGSTSGWPGVPDPGELRWMCFLPLASLCRYAPATSKHRKLLAEWATPALVCPRLSLSLFISASPAIACAARRCLSRVLTCV
jgi:hypothetical protein